MGDELLERLGLGHEPVEQLVLVALQLGDLGLDLGAVPAHRLGVAFRLAVVAVGDGRLGHEGTQARVVGLIGEVRELLGADVEFATQLPEPL